MKYNEKYDRYVTKGGLVYRYNAKQDKLVLCKLIAHWTGYLYLRVSKPKRAMISVHRLVYETFESEVQQGFEIDHINTIKDDNRVENLRLCSHKENMNNPLSKKHSSEAQKGRTFTEEHKQKLSDSKKGKKFTLEHKQKLSTVKKGKYLSDFGRKFKEHFGMSYYENPKLYKKEHRFYRKNNHKCSWE